MVAVGRAGNKDRAGSAGGATSCGEAPASGTGAGCAVDNRARFSSGADKVRRGRFSGERGWGEAEDAGWVLMAGRLAGAAGGELGGGRQCACDWRRSSSCTERGKLGGPGKGGGLRNACAGLMRAVESWRSCSH